MTRSRLVVVDPNLVDLHGHHPIWDRTICREAARRGLDAVIIGNRQYGSATLDHFPVHRLLDTTCYARFSDDRFISAFEDFEAVNDRVFQELCAIPADFFQATDLVLVPTTTENALYGTLAWMETFPAAFRPTFVVYLMLPSGIEVDDAGKVTTHDYAAALAYRLAFRRIKRSGVDVSFFASGRQHAREFSELAGFPIESHPVITSFDDVDASSAPDPKRVLLFAGDAKDGKGIGLVPGIIERVVPANPGIHFVVHANDEQAWGPALEAVGKLRKLAGRFENLDITIGGLDPKAYVSLLSGCGVITLPYDPVEYGRKSSGVMWEAIAVGSAAVAPRHTWLEREARAWDAVVETFAEHTPESIATAIGAFVQGGRAGWEAQARSASGRFRTANGINPLFDQLGDIWSQRLAAAAAFGALEPMTRSAEMFSGEGWYDAETLDGSKVRWSAKVVTEKISFPGAGAWTIIMRGPRLIGGEQVNRATVKVDGVELATTAHVKDGSEWELSAAFEEREWDGPERVLRLELPWTYRPEGERRELGVLANEIRLEPAKAAQAEAGGQGTVTPVSDSARPNADGNASVERHASWRAKYDPRRAYRLHLTFPEPMPPDVARSARVFVAGQPVELDIRPQADGGWSLHAALPQALLAASGATADIDLIFPEGAQNAHLVRLEGLFPADAAAQAGATDRAEAAKPAPPPKPEPPPKPVAEPVPPAAKADLSGPESIPQPSSWTARPASQKPFAACTLSESHVSADLEFINCRLQGFRALGLHAPDFYFKLMFSDGWSALELRENDKAFQLLPKQLSHVGADEWGRYVRLVVLKDGQLVASPELRALDEASPLHAFMDVLVAAVGEALAKPRVKFESAVDWHAVATNLASAVGHIRERADA